MRPVARLLHADVTPDPRSHAGNRAEVIADHGSSIVPGEEEAIETQRVEHRRQLGRLSCVVVVAVEARVGLAMPLEVERNGAELISEPSNLVVPSKTGFRETMQEHGHLRILRITGGDGMPIQPCSFDESVCHDVAVPQRLDFAVMVLHGASFPFQSEFG